MPEVLYNGEWIDKNYLKLCLDKQANDPEYQRKLKEEEQERKKHKRLEQKQKRIETQSRDEKIPVYMKKYHEEFPGEWSAEFTQKMLERATNAYYNDLQYEKDRERQEQYRKEMEEYSKRREEQERQRLQQEQEYRRKLPEQQLKMFLSGERTKCTKCFRKKRAEFFGHAPNCPSYYGIDIEPGLSLLKQEYDACKIIRLDEQTHNRLMEFAKSDEPILDLINRLIDIAQETKAAQIGEKTGVS